jgi:hypothetical protein
MTGSDVLDTGVVISIYQIEIDELVGSVIQFLLPNNCWLS